MLDLQDLRNPILLTSNTNVTRWNFLQICTQITLKTMILQGSLIILI